jgi:hypothetical protein
VLLVLLQLDEEDKENIMAIAPSFTTGLLGYNPREEQLQQQKLWAGLYGQAASPYEKIGIGLGQLGGALIGNLMGESATQKRERTLLTVKEAADQQFTPGSPEYYKYVADNLPAGAEYSQSKDLATQEFLKARKAADEAFAAERKGVREDPESLDVYTSKYATPLLAKAQLRGFDPEKEDVPQTTDAIKAFAKLYDLDKDPNYNKLMTLRTLAEKEAKKEERKAEIEALTIEKIESTIKKNKADLGKIASDKFEAGNRWNEERNSAIALFDANNLDPRKPLKGINLANTELVNAQRIALRDPWTGKSGSVIKQPGAATPPTAGAPNIKQLVESSGQVYDTDKYDYRIVNGQVQRRAK